MCNKYFPLVAIKSKYMRITRDGKQFKKCALSSILQSCYTFGRFSVDYVIRFDNIIRHPDRALLLCGDAAAIGAEGNLARCATRDESGLGAERVRR